MVQSLFIKVKAEDPGRSLMRNEAPDLWTLTEQVARDAGTRPIDEIRMTPGTELAVYERGSRREKSQDKAQRILLLGMGVLNGFRENAFRAVLALFKRFGAILQSSHTICQHFLEARGTVSDTAKEKVIQTKEMKSQVPPDGLTALDHSLGEFHHVVVDTHRHVATGCIAMCKMSVLVAT